MARVSKAEIELRTLLPEDAERVLAEPRFWTGPCFDTFLTRCEDVLFQDPVEGLKLAELAPVLADRVADRVLDELGKDRKVRALASLGNAYRARGDLRTSAATFVAGAALGGSELAKAHLYFRWALLRTDERRLDSALELANQAVSLFEINHRIQDLCPAMVVRGIVNLNRSRMGNAPAIRKAAEDFRKALSMCNGKKSPRAHYAAAHNLGLTILEGNLPWDDLKETIGSVKQARENLRKRKIKRRSVPDAKLRWILGLARSRSGWNPQAERLLTTARNDLITLGAMSEVALVSLDLGELYLAEDRWDDLARISADVVHMDRGSYSHEIFAALLLWRQAILEKTLDADILNHVYEKVYGIKRSPAKANKNALVETEEPVGW